MIDSKISAASAIVLLGWAVAGCLPHEPLPYSPNYTRVTLVDPPGSNAVYKAPDESGAKYVRRSGHAWTGLVPDACVTPDVAEQPFYLPSGCANSLNLQVMVEHQRDLVRGRRPGPPAAAPVAQAAERYLYGATEAEMHGRIQKRPPEQPPVAPVSTQQKVVPTQ
jgi:hypothetical protein